LGATPGRESETGEREQLLSRKKALKKKTKESYAHNMLMVGIEKKMRKD